uniref:Methyl-CpG binding domain protein 1b n=1 Tax=Gadus morhua TaxID=8049 RepID=A0A8C4YXK4_GADMO
KHYQVNKGAEAGNDDPPVDWFEPLEEDDDTHSWEPGHHEGSVAAESEKSGSVASDDKAFKRTYRVSHHRKSTNADEGWVDWPILGEGWKRRQVIRRSGSSVGQRDVYYVGPGGERVRSRVELAAVLGSVMNVAMFDFKTGEFHTGQPQHPRRKRVLLHCTPQKVESVSGRNPAARRRTRGSTLRALTTWSLPRDASRKSRSSKKNQAPQGNPTHGPPPCKSELVKFAGQTPLTVTPGGRTYCRQPNYTFNDDSMQLFCKSLCVPFWIPCLRCEACLTTSNCGSCHNCEDKLSSLPNTFTRLTCQKRRCLCPVRKVGSQSRSSDTEHSVNIEVDDAEDDMSDGEEGEFDEDDEEWPKRRRRRACGTCSACLGTTDCGKCDFCRDKPKFGGRNTKRQKCRLRQCQSRAKRHLLPLQLGPGRRKPRYTYSRKPLMKRSKELPSGGPGGPGSPGEDDGRPTAVSGRGTSQRQIPQVFSSAERQARLNVDPSSPLYKLLEELRAAALPILWYSILVEGPRLQIIQCSKQSRMADTAVLIEPDFCFRVTVQKQPLLPCHPLYDQHALHLSSVRQVVKLLLDLESYFVCQGIAMEERPATDGPIILDRALTCDFLVPGTVAVCAACSALCGPR